MTPEGRVKQKLNRRLVEVLGKDCYRFMPVQTGLGAATLDYLICYRGLFFGIETKADITKKLTPRQLQTWRDMEAAGATCFLVFNDETIERAIARMILKADVCPV